ncbi:hypothetical protein A6K25_13450 [Alteromonas stellipolaris]|uniref:hypothetical protein n=1 Tax=Alteromonas stellipolaris TaxID=233316 RepID=UPI0007B44CBA|nr:hypothetical protein [Alteromonas stellipolaris]ANB22192.1 hypothetical protein A6K25_13450 [Alteromonas stellipolaris]
MSFKSWKAGFWICFVLLLFSNGYWSLVVVDQALTNKYTSMELYSQEEAVTELGKLIVSGIESKSKKDVIFLLRQANPDAFIVDGEDAISYQNISFYFKNDKLVSIGGPRT